MTKVAITGDDPLVMLGLRSMLLPYSDVIHVRDYGSGTSGTGPVDITLYDPTRHASTRPTLESLLTDPASGRVVMYSLAPAPGTVVAMLGRGCAGFVDKAVSAHELVDALIFLVGGQGAETAGPCLGPAWVGQGQGLSPRESEVMSLITQGFTNEDISARLHLSTNTVKSYIRSAYRKLGITRRPQAVRWGMEHGMAGPRRPGASVTRPSSAV